MNEKQFRNWRTSIAIILAMIFGVSITQGNLLLPVITIITATIIMIILKRRVTDVLVDERIQKISGKAAQKTLQLETIAMAAASIVLIALRDTLPQYTQTGYTLSYTTCGLLLVYSMFYKHMAKNED